LSNIFDFCTKKNANSGAKRVFRLDGIQNNLLPARMADILLGTDLASVQRGGTPQACGGSASAAPSASMAPHSHRLTAIHPKRNIRPKWTIKSSKLEISPAGEIANNV
jgi:hypothetical protein